MSVWDMAKLASQYKEIQNVLVKTKIEAISYSGNVRVIMNGQQEVLAVRFSPYWLNSATQSEIAGELASAFNSAQQQSKEKARVEVNKITGLDMENFKGIF